MTAPSMLIRLRRPRPADLVQVSLTGAPQAVAAVARALAGAVQVTEMSHHTQPEGAVVIRIDAVCHGRSRLARRGGGR